METSLAMLCGESQTNMSGDGASNPASDRARHSSKFCRYSTYGRPLGARSSGMAGLPMFACESAWPWGASPRRLRHGLKWIIHAMIVRVVVNNTAKSIIENAMRRSTGHPRAPLYDIR